MKTASITQTNDLGIKNINTNKSHQNTSYNEMQLKQNGDKKLPKNVNEYRHIIDNILSRDSDVEWVLGLKAPSKPIEYSPLRERTLNQPNFYSEDFERYKDKIEKDNKVREANKLRLKGNTSDFNHIINNRLNMPANPSQIGFDTTLRKFTPFENTYGPNVEWKTLAMSPKKTLLDKYLAPLKSSSMFNLNKLKDHVCRPLETKFNVNY